MVYRDPRAAQNLIDQGEEEAGLTALLGPRPTPDYHPAPGSGMIPGNPRPFRFSDPVPGQDPGIQPAFQNAKPAVTTITPDRQTPFSRADAQALAALDPRALDEANALAARPESMPRMITGKNETTGESFQMQPTARVDRNALAKLYAAAQERKGQERQDAVRGQEQAGRERLVAIPGQQATERRGMDLAAEAERLRAQQQYESPERAQRLKQGEQKIRQGELAIDQSQFDQTQRNDPMAKTRAAADQQMTQLAGMPQTPAVRAMMAQLYPQTTVGSRLSPEISSGIGKELGRNPNDQGAEIDAALADPEVAALLADATKSGKSYSESAKSFVPFAEKVGNLGAFTPLGPIAGSAIGRKVATSLARKFLSPGESEMAASEDKVNRAIEMVMRKNPQLTEDQLREKVTQMMESRVTAPADDPTANRFRRSARKMP